MEPVRLGASGLHVSPICLGMMAFGSKEWQPWILELDEARPIILRAVERGVTYFDTANIYSKGVSEQITGEVLREAFSRREDYVVATKVWGAMGSGPNDRGLSRAHIFASIDQSLKRLGLDHVDLFQVHRWDPRTPIEETMAALHDVVQSGRARYIGASSMWAWQFAKAQHVAESHGWTRFITMQHRHNLLYREEEREMLPLLADQGVGSLPWSPLARGKLARADGADDPTRRAELEGIHDDVPTDGPILAEVARIAGEHGVPPAAIALAWLRCQPTVSAPIVGATDAAHVDVAIGSLEVELSDDDVSALERPYAPRPVTGHR